MRKYKTMEEIQGAIADDKPIWALVSGAQLRDTPMGAVMSNLDAGMFGLAEDEDIVAFSRLNNKSGDK